MVMVRIKRMGKQWASCGVPVSPPENRKGDANIKKLCPKLVPGQVITLPRDHNLLNQDCVEVVRGVGKDEFRRPWVFRSADEAAMANPTKSRLGPDQIAMGLNMAAGAVVKGREKLEARAEARRLAEADQPYHDDEDDDDGIYASDPAPARGRGRPLDDEGRAPAAGRGRSAPVDDDDDIYADDGYVPNPQNRLTPEEHEDIVRRDAELNDEDADEAVQERKATRGKGRATPSDKPRASRKR